LIVTTGGIAETVSATDTTSCLIVTSGSIAEGTASATDTLTATALWTTFVEETTTATDTQTVIEPILTWSTDRLFSVAASPRVYDVLPYH
jgi:hypothetical protein